MHPLFVYLLKANGLLVLFWLFYRLFLHRETFYVSIRWYFLGAILFSLTAPFYTFTKTVVVAQSAPLNEIMFTENTSDDVFYETAAPLFWETINWQNVLLYTLAAISIFKLLCVLYTVTKLAAHIRKLPVLNQSNIKISNENKTAYSFYKWIVIPRNVIGRSNFQMILNHENVHLRQKHTFDLIFIELVAAIFWFNPLIKLMQKDMNSNLEFIVDDQLVQTYESVSYQKCLINFHREQGMFLVNSFNANDLKQRIIRINSKKSNKLNKMKLFLITPVLALFFGLFQVKTVAQVKTEKVIVNERKTNDTALMKTIEDKKNINEFTFNADLLREDRKLFDEVAERYPMVIDDVPMNKKQLKEFDHTKIQSMSIRLNMTGKEEITTVYLSTKPTSPSYSSLNLKEIYINGNKATEEELRRHIEAENSKKDDFKTTFSNGSIKILDSVKINGKVTTLADLAEEDEKLRNEGVELRTFEFNFAPVEKQNIVYIINGKEAGYEAFQKLHPDAIEHMDVLKDQKTIERYGDRAKDGVIVITTKSKTKLDLTQRKTELLKQREIALQKRQKIAQSRQNRMEQRKEILEKTKQRREELEKTKQQIAYQKTQLLNERESALEKRQEIIEQRRQTRTEQINEIIEKIGQRRKEMEKARQEREKWARDFAANYH